MLNITTQTSSLINHILSCDTSMPKVGDGATILYGADRKPATVTQVFTRGKGTYAVLQRDSYTLNEKSRPGQPEFDFSPNEDGAEYTFLHTVNGWVHVYLAANKRYYNANGVGARMGAREHYFNMEI